MRVNYIDNVDCLEGLQSIPDNSVDAIAEKRVADALDALLTE